MTSEIANLRNLGPASAEMLEHAGILSTRQLQQLGAVHAFLAVKQSGQRPSLNLLWALEGALKDCHWNAISPVDKRRLRLDLERLSS